MRPRPDYGIDAPPVIRNLALGALACAVITPFIPWYLRYTVVSTGVVFAAEVVYMIWASRVGKIQQRERLFELIDWSKASRVLDVGCGRGLLLVGAATRLAPGARAIGIDLWNSADLGGNQHAATLENAAREQVLDRTRVVTGDMRAMPLASSTMDLVVSSMAIHNVPGAEGRRQSIAEIARVLKPGGTVLIQDMRHVTDYAADLQANGLNVDSVSGRQFRIFPPVRYVIATKGPGQS